jgi:nucleoside-diphosphate-sugar epimerase
MTPDQPGMDPAQQPPVFVTGGTGLLGAYLIREILARGRQVTALYRNRLPDLLSPAEQAAVNWVKGDILDPVGLEENMLPGMQVYHCAGMVSFNPARKDLMLKINAEGTAHVVNACIAKEVGKLVHVSSVSALGRKRHNMVVSEASKWNEEQNLSAYGKSKYLAEMEVWRGIGEGLDAVIVNPTIVLGVGDWHHSSAALFKNAYQGFKWYTDGVSGFTDAADVARVMYRLMNSPISAQRFIISAENKSFREVMSAIATGFGKKPPRYKTGRLMSGLIWRIEKARSLLTGIDPLLTRETAETARIRVFYDNTKILEALPDFRFRPVDESVAAYCREYLVKLNQQAQ